MSNAIHYLEAMGRNPTLCGLSPAASAAAMSIYGLEPIQRQALLARDGVRLNGLLGGRKETKCLIFGPDDEG